MKKKEELYLGSVERIRPILINIDKEISRRI